MQTTEILAAAGISTVILAAIAWIGDRRRVRRRDLDRFGFMPWTTIFFLALFAGVMLAGLAIRVWQGG